MAKLLVVDDERRYRELLERILAEEGHDVRLADAGREAIDEGCRFRPDVLLVDWMLKDALHGLNVAAALRAVIPQLRTVLITGFPSQDVRLTAAKEGFSSFLEKPFEAEAVREAVRRARSDGEPAEPRWAPFGVLEVNDAGAIVFANPVARTMFSEAGLEEAKLAAELFDPAHPLDLDAAAEAWCEVRPLGSELRWMARAQAPRGGQTRLVAIRHADDAPAWDLIEMLLDVREPMRKRWPYSGCVLLVEHEAVFRRFASGLLERCGAACFSAETREDAVRLLQTDPDFSLVILDMEMPGADLGELVQQMRALRPGIAILGNSERDREREARACGADLFLLRPWRLDDLIPSLSRVLAPAREDENESKR